MAMSWLWAGMVALSVLCGAVNGRMAEVSAAALEGAGAAVELCLGMLGSVCLWTGVMELMERCGLAGGLARLLRPVLCRLVVLNTASIQLLPTTVAGIRAACGTAAPMDILPAVWLSSALSVTAGLLSARLLQMLWRDR